MAPSSTLLFTLLKSGCSKKRMPSLALGSEMEQQASTNSKMKSIGIRILEERSMPFSTPRVMMKWVISTKRTDQTTGRHGLLTKLLKVLMNPSAVCPLRPPLTAWRMYSSVQPATTL